MSKNPPTILHTYDDWKRIGRPVRRGAKARHRDGDGAPLFAMEQTLTIQEAAEEAEDRREMEGEIWSIY